MAKALDPLSTWSISSDTSLSSLSRAGCSLLLMFSGQQGDWFWDNLVRNGSQGKGHLSRRVQYGLLGTRANRLWVVVIKSFRKHVYTCREVRHHPILAPGFQFCTLGHWTLRVKPYTMHVYLPWGASGSRSSVSCLDDRGDQCPQLLFCLSTAIQEEFECSVPACH